MSNESTLKKIEKLQEKKKADKIIHFLKSDDEEIISAALLALAAIHDETSVNQITPLIDSDKPGIRAAAAKALGILATEQSKTYLQHRMINETDETVKAAISEALAAIRNNNA